MLNDGQNLKNVLPTVYKKMFYTMRVLFYRWKGWRDFGSVLWIHYANIYVAYWRVKIIRSPVTIWKLFFFAILFRACLFPCRLDPHLGRRSRVYYSIFSFFSNPVYNIKNDFDLGVCEIELINSNRPRRRFRVSHVHNYTIIVIVIIIIIILLMVRSDH